LKLESPRKEKAKLTSVEALGWWLADRPRTEARGPFMETRLLLDRETNERLLYLSKRFSIPKATLLRELVRAAVKDVFAVIPGDPLPAELVSDLRGAGVNPESFRWFDLQSVKEDEEREELQGLKLGELDEEPLDEETAKRIWRDIRRDIGLEGSGEEEPG
jgi:hypothetical protein